MDGDDAPPTRPADERCVLPPEFRTAPGVSPSDLRALEAALGRELPADYAALMLATNGCSGFVGDRYVCLWSLDSILEDNEGYGVALHAPDLVLIGSNGSGTGYAIRWLEVGWDYVAIPFLDLGDEPERLGDEVSCLLR